MLQLHGDLAISMQDPNDGIVTMHNDENDPVTGLPLWTFAHVDGPGARVLEFAKLRSGTVLKDIVVAGWAGEGLPAEYGARIVRSDDACGFETEPLLYETGSPMTQPYGIAVGKLDINNSVDLVVACESGNSNYPYGGVAVFQNRSGGNFYNPAWGDTGTMPKYFSTAGSSASPRPRFVRVEDLNDDGRNDIIASNSNENTLGVLINTTPVNDDN